jgi:hypothetical protein
MATADRLIEREDENGVPFRCPQCGRQVTSDVIDGLVKCGFDAFVVKVRETWSRGAEVSFDVEAFVVERSADHVSVGKKMFAPGATVTRDAKDPFTKPGELTVTVSWSSSSSDKALENAQAQLAVMEAAVAIADRLQSNAAAWEAEKKM